MMKLLVLLMMMINANDDGEHEGMITDEGGNGGAIRERNKDSITHHVGKWGRAAPN